MKNTRLLVPAMAFLLSGCVAGPEYKAPETDLPAKFSESSAKRADSVTLTPWWENYRDKRLNALVQDGMDENLGVLTALERIVEARANVVASGAGALPSINGNAAAIVEGEDRSHIKNYPGKDVEITRSATAGLNASWVLDLFGQYRRSREAARASLDAAFDSVNVARLAYFSDLIATYIDLRYYQEAMAQTRRNLASRRETLKLINDIKEAGAVSRLDVVQAEGLVNQTLSELPSLETGFHQAANHIATLLGVPAASLTPSLIKGAGQPVPRYAPKTGIPADLIRNRPDIRRAERLLAAATASIGVAEAQLYPSISLGGTINSTRISSTAATGGLLTWSFGPSVAIPIFNGGALRAQVDIAKSGAAQQYLAWKQTVLGAVEEVETAQIALRRDYQTVSAVRRLVASYEEALSLARESYKSGASTVLDVLDAERNVANARLSLAGAVRQLSLDYVALNVAIGGGSDVGGEVASK